MSTQSSLASTGVPGLDEIIQGGLHRDRIYLLQGEPGVGKTTLAMQFLMAGNALGERVLYVTLSETRAELDDIALSHGWDLTGIDMVELSALEQATGLEDNTLFEPSEVELQETTRLLLAHVDRIQPARVVFDSLSELRLLAQSPLRFRRQILALKQHFVGRHCTVLLLDDLTSSSVDQQLASLAHGVLSLSQSAPVYGEDRRRVRIQKLRGTRFRGGFHDFAIRTGGVVVFPRITVGDRAVREPTTASSGIESLDSLVGGGLDRATATLITGPAGSGKSAIAIQYVLTAIRRGEPAAFFAFDERRGTLLTRTRSLGMAIDEPVASGALLIEEIDPTQTSPGELTALIKRSVEERGVRTVVIDSLNGYLAAVPDERLIPVQLHELLGYLAHHNVTTILVMAQHGLIGSMQTPLDVSYIADTVILLRYFEAAGRIRKAISVMKRRSGPHENAIRELTMDGRGIHVGEPLVKFSGVLTGVPNYMGSMDELDQ